jgi:GDP-L-fucose synthase
LLGLENPPDWVNLGSGVEISIGDLAKLVAKTVGYEGRLAFDSSKPDGTPRKMTDISLIKSTGWEPKIALEAGVAMAYQDFLVENSEGSLRV